MLIADSESTGFKYESDKIWVICGYHIEREEFWISFDQSISYPEEAVRYFEMIKGKARLFTSHKHLLERMQSEPICFHNYFQHDKPLIKKLYPDFNPEEEHDSYILSQLFNPDRGNHGLDAWAKRLRGEDEGKVVHEEWDRFSPEMLHRVIDDVKINVKVWEHLMKEKKEWEDLGYSWDEAIKIEYGIADLQGRQELHGVKLDEEKAYLLADEIYLEIQKIDEYLKEQLPMRVIPGTEYAEPFKKNGELKKNVQEWFDV